MSIVLQRTGKCSRCRSTAHSTVRVFASLPPVMVNSCTGKMGHAAAESLVAYGFPLVPHTFTGLSAGVAVKNIGVRGVPVQLVGEERRQAALDTIKRDYPNMMVVDYTLAHCVDDHVRFYTANGLPFVMGTAGGNRAGMREVAEAAGVYAVLPSPAGEQAAALFALLVSLGAPLPPHFEEYTYEAVGRSGDADALDLLNPAAAADIAQSLRLMGIQCDEAQVHRMRAMRQQRVGGGMHLEQELRTTSTNLRALEGRGLSRTCRLTAPGGHHTLMLRHYGLDRTAFAAGAVEAARFLAERVAEGASQRAYDMVDVLRGLQTRDEARRSVREEKGQHSSNVVMAGPVVNAALAV
ncbi:hypothetical protein VOLCADRAFT_106419 [Volvox carteri f. nagariensis]|uniref:Dihydrodipicolinate reductase N-terminal domain-containing protein n=1 Tax=Volvox carteri f. nagariensis TaxID=3068 RepID=D8U781_VOLCA|nr:uncharacterized protein VOLCADRAFT_106419 [Volvox carteri f. nagariensis]EFJ44438.1 hypothetical protein VOLCADRAFT_106419 [Volvox carteri f. nagariensis]|eukprot:XP_002954545.1 hypothetical protein VOLCADRAFT_106419 [Volvox carteri f. nagariensis]